MSSTNAFTSSSEHLSFKIDKTLLNVFKRMYHFPSFCNLSCFYYASNVLKVSSICTFLQLLIKCEKFLFYNVFLHLCRFFHSGCQPFFNSSKHLWNSTFYFTYPFIFEFLLYLLSTYWLRFSTVLQTHPILRLSCCQHL